MWQVEPPSISWAYEPPPTPLEDPLDISSYGVRVWRQCPHCGRYRLLCQVLGTTLWPQLDEDSREGAFHDEATFMTLYWDSVLGQGWYERMVEQWTAHRRINRIGDLPRHRARDPWLSLIHI